MQTESRSNEALPRAGRRAEVTGVVHVDDVDRAAADRSVQLIKALAGASAHGPVEIAETYDSRAPRLTLTVSGALPAVLRVLNGKSPSAERLIEERADTSFVANVYDIGAEKAIAINDHLLNAAKNHPPGDPPLDVRTEHEERAKRLRVKVSGSLFATSYLLFLLNLHLTQSRT
jgi:hypothetical protein